MIRAMHEERGRMIEKVDRLEGREEMMDRDVLTARLETTLLQVIALQKLCAEGERKVEVLAGTLGVDNRHLRGRIGVLTAEKVVLGDRIVGLETVRAEKDKIIASLSIYRHNAVHRKVQISLHRPIRNVKFVLVGNVMRKRLGEGWQYAMVYLIFVLMLLK